MKYLFLDTNIFLHFKHYTDIPWSKIKEVGTDDFKIIVAPIVISELDGHKNSGNNREKKRARNVLLKIEEAIEGTGNKHLIILTTKPSEATFKKNQLFPSDHDDCLLAAMIEYLIQPGDEKILISDDTGIRIKAKTLNFHCVRPGEEYKLEEELDETEKELKSVRDELLKLKNSQPKISLEFSNGTNMLKYSPKYLPSLLEYVEKESKANKREYSHWQKSTEISQPLQRALILANFNKVTDSQIEKYNEKLDKYYGEYDNYLYQEYAYKEYLNLSLHIDLRLVNTGTIPGEDIDIHLHFPDGFELVEELKDEPDKPEPPYKPQSAWDIGPMTSFYPALNIHNPNHIVTPGPRLTRLEKTNSYDVEYKVPKVKHHQNVDLPKVFACFSSTEEMNSFHIDYSITVANHPDKIEGQLHCIIEKT